jgi:peptidoglycan hydrolase CwlO-like protein
MSVEVLELPEAEKLAPITKVGTEIVRMREAYSGLTIKDANDKEGFGKVTAARKEVKALRVQVDKERKTLIDDAVKWQRQVNEVAKGITEQLVAIEEPLQQKENDFIAERERIKQEAERQRQEKLRARCLVIASIPDVLFDGVSYILQDVTIDADGIENMSDDAFQTKVEAFEAKYQTILEGRQQAERIAKEEADRLEAARKEQEAAAAELKRQQEELAAERKRLDDEKAAHEAALKAEQEGKEAEARRIH